MRNEPFLIAGGGIAGLATALSLAGIGQSSRLFEQAPAFEEVGAGLQISPNAVRALQHIGAWDAVAPNCVIPGEIHVRDGLKGGILQRIRLGKAFEQQFGAPYRVAHRADLLGGLLETAKSQSLVSLATASRVTGAANRDGGGVALRFADGREETGPALIAADGVRSAIRATVFDDPDPVYRGQILYRTLLPIDKVPPGIVADAVTLWLFPGGHVVHYPVSNWRQFNVVATIEGKWTAPSWSEPGNTADLKRYYGNATEALYELLNVPTNWLRWMGADRHPIARWSDGAIALIGDAAHATLPYLAQGAAMSMEDACVLARHLRQTPDIAEALAGYGSERAPRTTRIQQDSRARGHAYHAEGLLRVLRNTTLRLMPAGQFLNRLSWIYDWQP